MIYVLIMSFYGCYTDCLATAQFADLPSCQAAIVAAKEKWRTFDGICVPYHVEHK